MALLLAFAIASVARSQTFDAHGPTVPPDGPSVRDPVFGFGANVPGAPVVGLLGEGADALLVREVTDGATVTEQPVVDDLFGVGAELFVPISARVAAGASVPVWLASEGEAGGGSALGDVHLWLPVRVAVAEGRRVAVVPFLRLPTGADVRFLGDPGPGAGVLASGAVDAGVLVASLDAGLDASFASGVPDWPGGLSGRFASAIGLAPADAIGVHLEWRGRAPLFRSLPGVPTEALVTLKARPDPRLWVTGGAGTAVTRGVGAAGLRLEVAAHAVLGRADADADTPDGAAPAELHVVDERRWPIRGAVARVGTASAETDHEGYALLPARTWKVGRIEVEAEGFEPAVLADLAPESTSWEIVLVRAPVPVAVSVVGPDGPTSDVAVAVSGPGDPGPPTIDEAGVRHYGLRPGTWTITMDAPGLGRQERTVVIADERTEPVRVDAILAPVADPRTKVVVKVVDRQGVAVEDAVVAGPSGDLGTTGTGGDLVVHGLAPGETPFTVRSTDYGEGAVARARVESVGTTTVEAVLEWPPGSVVVRVHGPDGRPVDARVAVAGPANLPSRAVGSDGEELLVLRPGEWDVFVSSPTLGSQQRHVSVTDRPGELVELSFVLLPLERGNADLEVRVADVDGAPVPDVAVRIDGREAGRTGPDGRVVLIGLDPGERFLSIDGELLVPKQTELELVPGRQAEHVTAWYVTGVVDVAVKDAEGRPVDALVAFSGPSPVPPLAIGPDGHGRAVLPPGTWQVAVSNERYGTQVRDLSIAQDDHRDHRLSVAMLALGEEAGRVILTVVDPYGRSVVGAQASIDGHPVGTLAEGALSVEVPTGPVEIGVAAELHVPVTEEVEVAEITPVNVVLPWATGVLEVKVVGPAGPADALVLVSGPEPVSPRQAIGGTARFGLSPGTWFVLASEPGYAADERKVAIPASPGLTSVELKLSPVGADEGEILLTVEDPEGRPIAGVDAVVAGRTIGKTSEGGTVALPDLPAGTVEVALSAPDGFVGRALPVAVERGQQDRVTVVLPYEPQPVAVKVVGPDGAPVEATVAVAGPSTTETSTRSGSSGDAVVPLPPGTWVVTAETPTGVATAEVRVERGKPVAPVALAVEKTVSTVAGGQVKLSQPLLFDVGRHELRPEVLPILDDVARRLRADRSAALVEVQGHTSEEGGVAYNQALSERRAAAVHAALVARGVPRERLVARGYGLSRPVTTATDEASRQRNRRVELVVLESGD